MIDNFVKVILLTPDILYDTTVGDIGVEGMCEVFKEYEKLDKLSAENLFKNNGRLSFLEVPDLLFDHIVSKLVIEEGQLKLASYMHTFKNDRKIVLCISYNKFQSMVQAYKGVLIEKQSFLIQDLNRISEELIFISKLSLDIGVTDKELDLTDTVS